MTHFRASGDLRADRRYAYAQALLNEGDASAAADMARQTLELVPDWVPAWILLAVAEERSGSLKRAIAALEEAEARDQGGLFGARLDLARLRGDSKPGEMPAAYVSALFDDYAPRFDQHLTETLAYRGPSVLVEALTRAGAPSRFGHALDLGCGTGLMGRALADRVDVLEGVDLSPRMVAEAERTGLYRRLAVGDVLAHLQATAAGRCDLVVAADVFVYLGDLEPVIAEAARVTRSGGHLAFTVQHVEGTAFRLGADLRFGHSKTYLRATMTAAGWTEIAIDEVSTRRERGIDVPGLVVVGRKP